MKDFGWPGYLWDKLGMLIELEYQFVTKLGNGTCGLARVPMKSFSAMAINLPSPPCTAAGFWCVAQVVDGFISLTFEVVDV